MERFGAAAVSRSRHLPSRNLLRKSLQIKGSEILALKQVAYLPACRSIDHQAARPGDALQAGSEVRRSPYCRLLPRFAPSDWFSHDDQTGSDPYSHLQRRRSDRPFSDRLDHSQGSTNSLFGIRLMCRRPPEINKHSIPDEASHAAAKSRHGRRYTVLIDANYGAEIFRIEAGRQCRGACQVAEHYAELTPLCNRAERVLDPPLLRVSLARLVGWIRPAHRGDRSENHATVPDRDYTEILKVICRQMPQDLGGDTVSMKCRGVAAHP
jgi:hypothetical protein